MHLSLQPMFSACGDVLKDVDPWRVIADGVFTGAMTRIMGKLLAGEQIFSVVPMPTDVDVSRHFVIGALPAAVMSLANEILNAERFKTENLALNILKKMIVITFHGATAFATCKAFRFPVINGMCLAALSAGIFQLIKLLPARQPNPTPTPTPVVIAETAIMLPLVFEFGRWFFRN